MNRKDREFKENNLTFKVKWVYDESPDLSHLDPNTNNYEGIEATEKAKYHAQDAERRKAYDNGEWFMMGCCVEVYIETSTRWSVPHKIARASLWGLESDMGDDDAREIEEQVINEAWGDLEATKKALNLVEVK